MQQQQLGEARAHRAQDRWRAGSRLRSWLLVWALLWPGMQGGLAHAYQLQPVDPVTRDQLKRIRYPFLTPIVSDLIAHFSEPVHEGLTAKMYACDTAASLLECSKKSHEIVPAAVLDGLKWNDNPVFRVTTASHYCRGAAGRTPVYIDLAKDPLCWSVLFYDAKWRAHKGEQFGAVSPGAPFALIYRIHFGDLQFIHGMASWDGEDAAVTYANIMAWAELTYKVADGEAEALDMPISALVPGLANAFQSNGFTARSLWKPARKTWTDDDNTSLRAMALGSLLHTIEDSFSTAHTDRSGTLAPTQCVGLDLERLPGTIHQFFAYNRQDSKKHSGRDSPSYAERQLTEANKATAVTLGVEVLQRLRDGKRWDQARPLFECIFAVGSDAIQAAPGKEFE